ncbi:hypothetical protein MTO96_027135 [Rhipicephalus appendiculatus]
MGKKPRGGEPGRCAPRCIDDSGALCGAGTGETAEQAAAAVCVFARRSAGCWWAWPCAADGYGSGFFSVRRAKRSPLSLYSPFPLLRRENSRPRSITFYGRPPSLGLRLESSGYSPKPSQSFESSAGQSCP